MFFYGIPSIKNIRRCHRLTLPRADFKDRERMSTTPGNFLGRFLFGATFHHAELTEKNDLERVDGVKIKRRGWRVSTTPRYLFLGLFLFGGFPSLSLVTQPTRSRPKSLEETDGFSGGFPSVHLSRDPTRDTDLSEKQREQYLDTWIQIF